jgi:hypothetical protein
MTQENFSLKDIIQPDITFPAPGASKRNRNREVIKDSRNGWLDQKVLIRFNGDELEGKFVEGDEGYYVLTSEGTYKVLLRRIEAREEFINGFVVEIPEINYRNYKINPNDERIKSFSYAAIERL